MKKNYIILLFVFTFTILIRLPGLFWGISPYPEMKMEWFDHDEFHYVRTAVEIRTEHYQKTYFPLGFPVQIVAISKIFEIPSSYFNYLILARILSLFYGTMIVMVLYLLANILFDFRTSIFCAFFCSSFSLLSIYSHIATANIANTFYFYLCIYLSIKSLKQKKFYLVSLAVTTGIGLSMMLNLTIIAPGILALLISKKNFYRNLSLFIFITIATFFFSNGLLLTYQDLICIRENFSRDLVQVIPSHNNFYNIIPIILTMIASLSIVATLWAYKGLKNFFFYGDKKYLWILCLPLVFYLIFIFIIDVPFDRYLLPLLPFMALVSGYGLNKIKKYKKFFIALTFFYTVLCTLSVEGNFIYDTRTKAFPWIIKNIPFGSKIYLFQYSEFHPFQNYYCITAEPEEAEYLILHERYYRRYLSSVTNPIKNYPDFNEVYHGNPKHLILIQNIFKGKSDFQSIKKFSTYVIFPEIFFRKNLLGSYPDIIGDLIIAKKK